MRYSRKCMRFIWPLAVAVFMTGFALQPQPAAPVFTLLYSFTGSNDGADPEYQLLAGDGGVLYGTCYLGGSSDQGTAFSLTPPSTPGGAWTETTIQTFSGSNGSYPSSGLAKGLGNSLYGVTLTGGYQGAGAVYVLMPPAVPGTAWTATVIYSFPFELFGPLGLNPWWGLRIGKNGVVYGVTSAGGANASGTAYSLTPSASAPWTENTIYTFGQRVGPSGPEGGLLASRNGVLYGVSGTGGSASSGTVYSLTPPVSPGAPWTESILYSFPGGAGGYAPYGPLTAGPGGVLYGAALASPPGAALAFSLTPPATPGGAWTSQILQRFPNGLAVDGGLLLNPKTGVLYGAAGGGTNDWGILCELKPPPSGVGPWGQRVLHTFNNTDGRYPNTPVLGPGGVLYGTTIGGGTSSCMCGTVYSLQP